MILKIDNAHESNIKNLNFSNDGKLICSASWDKTVKIWEN